MRHSRSLLEYPTSGKAEPRIGVAAPISGRSPKGQRLRKATQTDGNPMEQRAYALPFRLDVKHLILYASVPKW